MTGQTQPGDEPREPEPHEPEPPAERAVDVRIRLIEATIAVLRQVGLERADAETVAEHAGMAVEELRQHFPNRGSLLAATIERWSGAISRPLRPIADDDGAVAYLSALVAAYAEEPALMRALASTLATSTDPGNGGAEFYRTIYLGFRRNIRDALVRDVRLGREPATMDPNRGAQQLLALYDGLRIQALLVDDLDIVEAFDRAATRMRRGWSEPYRPGDVPEIPIDRSRQS